jgi:thiamine-phosphate diphosphorylase
VVLVTDRASIDDTAQLDRIARLGRTGSEAAVIVRDKQLAGRERLDLALRLRKATSEVGARLLIAMTSETDLELAAECEADGVHVPSKWLSAPSFAGVEWPGEVSVACHGDDELARAVEIGASWVLVSPIFSSPGKGAPVGVGALRAARARLDGLAAERGRARVGLVALGGVDASNADACIEAGADGVASIRADLTAWLLRTARPRASDPLGGS